MEAIHRIIWYCRYVRREQKNIQKVPTEQLFLGEFNFGPLPWQGKKIPKLKGIIALTYLTNVIQANFLSHTVEWKEEKTPDGKTYYW